MKARFVVLVAVVLGSADLRGQQAAAPPTGAAVRRRVVSEEPVVMAQRIGREAGAEAGEGRKCEGRGRALRADDEVRVWLTPRMGRRDQPDLSFILRLDGEENGTVYLLYHAERAYSELPYPLPRPQSRSEGRKERDSREPLPVDFAAAPRATAVTVDGLSAVEYQFATFDRRKDTTEYQLRLLPDAVLGTVAFRLESLVASMIPPGADYVRGAGTDSGIVLSWDSAYSWLGNPPFDFGERLLAFERQAVPAEKFAPPPEYRRIPFSPSCFATRDPRM